MEDTKTLSERLNDVMTGYEAHKNMLKEQLEYWQERCGLAENCLAVSPCDPDITSEQIKAHEQYNNFLNQKQSA